jgi:ribosome maturation factor RimP
MTTTKDTWSASRPQAPPGGRAGATAPPASSAISPELERELKAIADASGCELVHAEYKGHLLRLFIDRPEGPNGVDLSDCETVSKQVSALLDVVDFAPGRYTLEVSSPGLDRQLFGPRDYRRFAGSLARVTHRDPESGRKRTDVGRLGEYRERGAGGGPELTLELSDRNEALVLPVEAIEIARLEIEL